MSSGGKDSAQLQSSPISSGGEDSAVLFQSHSISSGGKNSDLFDSIPFLQEEEEIQQRFFEANGYLQEEEENPAVLWCKWISLAAGGNSAEI